MNASAGMPAVQAANLLIRHCAAAKVSHLLRILPPDLTLTFTSRVDELIQHAFASVNGLTDAELHDSISLLHIPLSHGGMGLRTLKDTRHCAHVASWLHCAQATASVLGNWVPGLTCWADAVLPCQQHVHRAASHLSAVHGVNAFEVCNIVGRRSHS